MSTIAAISTPHAAGGISVIRISGENAVALAEKLFTPYGSERVSEMKGYTCCYGKISDGSEELDDGILTVFRAPKSYTGEDVAEISCHGGIYVTNRILRAVYKVGAEPAEAGEFTKRAFLNGKLSLTQAEAVMDIISAQGEQSHKSALAVREGRLFSRIKAVSDRLVTILGELGAWVDYPEEDIPEVEENTLLSSLTEELANLRKISDTYDSGRILREGIETAIVGKPNVGKSTLMNLLSGYERSIVTDIAGTTRDVVEESVRLGNVILRLCDTAGIHETDDTVEDAGIRLARKKLDSADLIMAVFDSSQEVTSEDISLMEQLSGKRAVCILNKNDLGTADTAIFKQYFDSIVEISAKDGSGIEALQTAVEEIFHTAEIDTGAGLLANERQKQCVDNAVSSLEQAVSVLQMGETLDAVTVLIDEAADFLLRLTGEKASEAVVNEVFSHFCVGK